MNTDILQMNADVVSVFICCFFCVDQCSHEMQCSADRFGLLRFRSPLLTQYLLVSFPPGT